MKKCICLAVLLTSVLAGWSACSNTVEQADFVIINGNILTVDSEFSEAEAVAISKGIFIAVGSNSEIENYIGDETEVLDAENRTIIPGLIETHVHATGAARSEANQSFVQLDSIQDVQEWLREAVKQSSEKEWIRLPRIEVTRIKEGRWPTKEELDKAAPNHPAVFIWQYANHQIQVLNTAAIEAAGITRDTPAPEGGRIHKNEHGELTGVIENGEELTLEFLQRRDISDKEYFNQLEQLLNKYSEMGITSVMERGSNIDGYRTYQKLEEEGRLPVRATITFRLNVGESAEEVIEEITTLPVRFGEGTEKVKAGPLKVRVDGGILYGTAFMRDPFGDKAQSFYGFEDPDHRGNTFLKKEILTEIIRAGYNHGWQMSSHVTGDAGVDFVLDALEQVIDDENLEDHRYTLIHAYFPNEETAKRAAKLGVAVDTQPAWYYKDGDALFDVLGESRLNQFIGVQEWLRAGVKIVLNSDHMLGFDPDRSLNPYNPFLTMYTAITRKTEDGQIFNSDQQISRNDALRMMTSDAAWLTFDEENKGSIEVGKLADLAILTDNPLTCDEEQIRQIRSLITILGGKIVYNSLNE